jgi:hypothetical protein
MHQHSSTATHVRHISNAQAAGTLKAEMAASWTATIRSAALLQGEFVLQFAAGCSMQVICCPRALHCTALQHPDASAACPEPSNTARTLL